MKSEPRAYKSDVCSHCSGRTYLYITIAPNHNIIVRKGFGALKNALAFKPAVYGLTCYDGCPGKFTLLSKPNVHIFIELHIRNLDKQSYIRSQSGLRCKLEEFPLIIDLKVRDKGSIKTAKYRYTIKL